MTQRDAAKYMAQDLIDSDAPGLYEMAAELGYRSFDAVRDQAWFVNTLADLIQLNGGKVS